jgi:hypothetical protein
VKYKFDSSIVVEARSLEEAIQSFSSHISTIARQVGNGQSIADLGAKFSVQEVDDKAKAVDLTVPNLVPVEPTLDPKSPAFAMRQDQIAAEKLEKEAAERQKANVGKTDAEVLAEHSAKEQGALNKKED